MADKKFANELLASINEYRVLHQVEPLTYNDDIAKISQKWADHLAKDGTLSHNQDAKHEGKEMGENCAMSWSSTGQDYTGKQTADQWYSEIERYDFAAHSGPRTGHFTQSVWKASKEFGCGKTQSKDGKWMVVGNFFPAGNYIGKNAENVFPTKDGKFVLPPKPTVAPSSSGSGGSGGGTSVSRQIKKETIGSGPTAVVKTTITETTTHPDGSTSVKTSESTEPVGAGGAGGHTAAPPAQNPQEFIAQVVAEHNKHRKLHGNVSPLKHNTELTEMAQKWADHLAETGALEHSDGKYKGEELGENVASRSSSGPVNYTGAELVDQWYSESSKFDYSEPEGKPGVRTGHFTQVVWKGSEEIGIGRAVTKDGHRVFAVCNYHPAGNVIGQFKDNVLPPA